MSRFESVRKVLLGLTAVPFAAGLVALVGCGQAKYAGEAKQAGAPAPSFETTNTESYDHIAENPFRAVAAAPLSTFSADVNSASYSNVRRFLTEGKLPPRDAVFLADMINYFPYRYPEPAGDDPVSLTLDLDLARGSPGTSLPASG